MPREFLVHEVQWSEALSRKMKMPRVHTFTCSLKTYERLMDLDEQRRSYILLYRTGKYGFIDGTRGKAQQLRKQKGRYFYALSEHGFDINELPKAVRKWYTTDALIDHRPPFERVWKTGMICLQ